MDGVMASIEELGGHVDHYLPDSTLLCVCQEEVADAIAGLPGVAWVVRFPACLSAADKTCQPARVSTLPNLRAPASFAPRVSQSPSVHLLSLRYPSSCQPPWLQGDFVAEYKKSPGWDPLLKVIRQVRPEANRAQ